MLMPLRVMSFNIRYGAADDGPNRWDKRSDLVIETIRRFDPDVLSLQEALDFQLDELSGGLDGYERVGTGREDGERRGEFAAILFRSDRFVLKEAGQFWLSETPNVPGSMSWGTSQPRIVTWCRLAAAEASPAVSQPVTIFNTHFDVRSELARRESAKLLRQQIENLEGRPAIVTGDFNTTEDDSVYRTLRWDSSRHLDLMDAYRAVHPKRSDDELTRHGFQPDRAGSRIDWILHTRHFTTVQATIDRTCFDGRLPSDHYPVTAVLTTGGETSAQSPCAHP